MDIYEKVKETAMQSGMWQTGFINTQDLLFYPEIRKICKENSCRNYGTTWACPPAVGTIEECKKRVMQYEKMLLFSIKYNLKDSYDIEGYGFQIYELAKAAGIKYNNGENTVTFFGGLLFRK